MPQLKRAFTVAELEEIGVPYDLPPDAAVGWRRAAACSGTTAAFGPSATSRGSRSTRSAARSNTWVTR